MKCPKCKAENPDDNQFCGKCGTSLIDIPTTPTEAPTETEKTPKKSAIDFAPGQHLGKRYQIIEEIGRGGMGRVYKAVDKELNRIVALKMIKLEISSQPGIVERFKKEIKLASEITHENVCRIHDLGEVEEIKYISMQYIKGQNLREFIKTSKRLNVETSIHITKQICQALTAAHKKGVIHRDLKPQNIMLDREGNAYVMDFGIARSLEAEEVTKPGLIIGTPHYMSPEQAEGKAADTRSDIYSLGCIIYKMLTGKPPFEADTSMALLHKHLKETPKPPSQLNPQTPSSLEKIILKCMEKDRAQRYQSINEILQDLKKPPPIVIELPKAEKSIVVLPFEDISPGKDNEYFSDGLTEEIITDLSKIHSLRVISRNSAMMLKGTRKSTKTIGQELDVQYILEGSVRKAGNNLRITAQLIDAAGDKHLWAEKYKGTLEDVFDIQEKVSRSIVDTLKLKLSHEESKKIAERPIENVHAYECYLRARHEIWYFTKESCRRTLQYLQEALEIVGDNVLLYAGMAEAYFILSHTGAREMKDGLKRMEECAKKIFELEPESSYGHCYFGLVKWKEPSPQEGVGHLKRAFEINPNDHSTLTWLGFCLAECGKPLAAEPIVRKLLEIDPLSAMSQFSLGWLHIMAGQFDLALEPFHKAHQMDPGGPLYRFKYAQVLALNHRLNEAYSFIDLIAKDTPQNVFAWLGLFFKYALKGDKTEALQSVTQELKSSARWDETWSFYMAKCYALIDEKEEALDWIENAINRGFINHPYLNEYDQFLENIRGEKRFKKLMKKVKYQWENFEV